MLTLRDLNFDDIVFTHIDPVTNMTTDICVTKLLRDVKVRRQKVIEIAVDPEWARYCIHNRGLEQHRLERLKGLHGKYHDPILYVHWGDGSKLQIDGVHRYVAAWMDGCESVKVKILPVTVWRPYIVTGMEQEVKNPDAFQRSYSGIK